MAAKDSYDELEQEEEKKEKARLRREEKREDKAKTGESTLPVHHHKHDAAAEAKSKEIKDAEKRAHILSERQSTFLSGLFSTKSPWDTSKGLRS
jgi:hypothetical protein